MAKEYKEITWEEAQTLWELGIREIEMRIDVNRPWCVFPIAKVWRIITDTIYPHELITPQSSKFYTLDVEPKDRKDWHFRVEVE